MNTHAATPNDSSQGRPPLDDLIVRTGLRARLEQIPRAALSILCSLAVLCIALYARVETLPLFIWASLVASGAIFRWVQGAYMLTRIDRAGAAQLHRDDFHGALSLLVHSAIVGSAFWLIAANGDSVVNMNLTVASVLFTVPTIIGAATRYWMVSLGAIANIGQGVFYWFGVGPNHGPQLAIAAMLLATLVLFVTMSRIYAAQFSDSVRLRVENSELLSRLEQEKHVVEDSLGKAREASLSKSRFLAAASHDLRQPLHALSMFLGTLSFHVATDEGRRLLSRTKETAQVLEDQFDSLLDLSRFDVDAVVPDIKSFRLGNSIERLIEEFRAEADAKQIEISASIAPTALPAIAKSDPILVGRVLRNLLDNAVKFTTTGSVNVCVSQQANRFTVEVVDTGPGIPVDQHARIFGEYIQLTNPARQRRHGVGLGLAIVNRIDQLLGLNLTLTSTVGVGSRFSFSIPAAAASDIEAQSRSPLSNAAEFKTNASIWILDDDPVALESLQGQLSAWGATVTPFIQPDDVFAELKAGGALPNWLFTDDMLGGSVSGLEAAQMLSEQFRFEKICLITGNTEPARLAKLRSSGFSVIIKPAKAEQLIALIES